MYQWRVAGGFERSEVQFTDTYLKNKLLSKKVTVEFVNYLSSPFLPSGKNAGRPRCGGDPWAKLENKSLNVGIFYFWSIPLTDNLHLAAP